MAGTRSDQIRNEIRSRILSGRLAPGARLPTERDLAVRYGVSLTTINKVMAGLEVAGLVERQRGTGTFVRPDLARRAVGIVLASPHTPPGPRFWAHLGRLALESAAKMAGRQYDGRLGGASGVRAYLAAGTVPSAETPLARDALAGRLSGALLLGAGVGAAAVLEDAGLPFVELVTEGARPGVRVAWR